MRSSHPWRAATPGALTIDPIVSTRSAPFVAFLETLPTVERRQIEAAERAFVMRANLVTSAHQTTFREFSEGLLGVKENEPAQYRGFVV